ncbi:glycoside hydrolase family 6 protein [Streptomyces sp. NBC_01537]|uniref:glycoside hydrolase family 6 protein n=1 Tax=Streptomyces sp. NBC_01537 TaxID=2903896 RepID=UPI00386F6E6E
MAVTIAALIGAGTVTGGVMLSYAATSRPSETAATDGATPSLPQLADVGRPSAETGGRAAAAGGARASGSPSASASRQAAGASARATTAPASEFFNDPQSQVNQWVAANKSDSREPLIASKIASRPQAVWFSTYKPSTVTADVRRVTSAAAGAGKVPVLVAYQIPNRDCGGASAGGAPDLASYDAWAKKFAAGLGSGEVIVILEPDSVALTTCLSSSELNGRYASLTRAGAAIHAADSRAKVYFDAGHSHWNSAADQAAKLRSAGVLTSGDGIYTNVSNFQLTSAEIPYAKQVLAALGGSSRLHAVIDTGRNGNGAPADGSWCDPAGRAVGTAPTTATGDAAIDAFLWVKPPGEVDGCAGPTGSFSPDYAAALAGG